MKSTHLAEQIEKLVRDHLAQVHADAARAMERAFGSARAATNATGARKKRTTGARRDPAVVAELAERLHRAVLATPGESMIAYAKQLDASVRELHRPMTLLKRARRLRTVGVRNNTRYFPTPGS